MSTRSRGSHSSSSWLLAAIIVFSLCRGTLQIAKNFVNSSTPDLRPTFVVNFDTSTVICQQSADPTDLHILNMSSLCDGKQDCFVNPAMHDEVFPYCEHKCESTCSGKGACLYDGSKPQCYCDSGFSGAACELQDKNECLEHPCHMMAQCQNTLGSYECRCLPGYQGNGHECTDIDECAEKVSSSCPEHSKCINLPGTYYCNCTQGFSPKGNQGSGLDKCADINECETGAHNCEKNEICENTIGSFKCVTKCSPGYELLGGKCEDVDECSSDALHKCDVRAECINTIGGYKCECDEGFDGDGKNCQPKSSCRKNSAICDRHASCHIVLDICDCKTGYTGDGITCHDIDECDAKETPCSAGGRCLNLDGGYVCCKDGQDDQTCIKDQGAFCSGGCGDNAICSNSTCECISGYQGDPRKKCTDINECVENDSICGGVGDRCVNLFGGFKCCQHGSTDPECTTDQAFSSDSSTISSHGADFTTTGEQIIEGSGSIQTSSGGTITVTRGLIPKDVELTTSGRLACTSYCPANSECVGGFCECVKGYGGNALVGCEDVDECITETCDEEANEWCVNLIGGFVCCNPTNATHDDCLGLEITREKGLQVIGGNEEDTIVAARSNHSTSDQLITQVVQQSRNFSSGQIILTRGKVPNGEAVIQTSDGDEFGLEISAADLAGSGSGILLSTTLEPKIEGSGGTTSKTNSGVWTEEEDGEDDDLMEEGSGSWSTTVNGTGFTGSPRSEGTIRVRITTLGEDGETETATKAGVRVPEAKEKEIEGSGTSTTSSEGSTISVTESGSSGSIKTSSEGSATSSGSSGSSTSSGEGSGSLKATKPSEGSATSVTESGLSGSSKTSSEGSATSSGTSGLATSSEKPSEEGSGTPEVTKPSESSTPTGDGSSGSSGASTTSSEGSATSSGSSKASTSSGEGSGSLEVTKPSESSTSSGDGSSGASTTSSEGSATSVTESESSGSVKTSSEGSPTSSGSSGASTSSGEGSGATEPSTSSGKRPEPESSGPSGSSGSSTSSGDGSKSSEANLPVKKDDKESTSSGVTATSSGKSPSSEVPEGSGEWVESGSKGHFESGSKVTVTSGKGDGASGSSGPSPTSSGPSGPSGPSGANGTSSGKPDITTDGEDSSSVTSGGEKGPKSDSGDKPTTNDTDHPHPDPSKGEKEVEGSGGIEGSGEPSEGILTTSSGGKNATFERGTKLEKVTGSPGESKVPGTSSEVGLEITDVKKTPDSSNEVGLEIVWESTTTAATETTPDSDKVGLEISGGDLVSTKSTKKPIEGSGTGDEEITATTRDISKTKSTKRPKIEIDGGENGETSEVDTKPTSPTTAAPESTTTTPSEAITPDGDAGSGEVPEASSSSTSAPESSTSSAPAPEASESTTVPSPQPATITVPSQNREEPRGTKDTFALPTTTTTTEAPVEIIKCTSSDECGMDALCERRTGVCRCEPGFEGAPPKKECVDVDECATGDHKCHDSARCQNFVGGYACFCPTGFRKTEDGSCEDIDECHEHNSTCCGANAQCVNKPGTYSCECEHGFLGDGYHCVPNTRKPCDKEQIVKMHCAESNMSCEVDTLNGAVECKECMSGYEKKGAACEDVNECDKATTCSPNASCLNLNGTFSCTCKSGFRGDGFMCTDINECDEKHPCHPHAECTNLEGSFECQCHNGFEGDGVKKCTNPLEKSCEDVQKFCGRVDHVSCLSVRIYNGSLSSVCECEPGFRFDKEKNTCVDIDECDENRNNCDPASAICINTEGSFKCECAEGYEGEGGVCTDIDECDRGMAGCDSMAMCINRMGSCGCKCMAGYTGDGAHCTKIPDPKSDKTTCTDEWSRLCELEKKQCTVDEEEVPQCGACLPGHHPINGTCQSLQISGLCAHKNDCNKHAECIDILPDSHFCSCPDGFIGDGMMCDDVDECTNTSMCDEDVNSQCENTIGSFRCVCVQGYRKDGDKCVAEATKQPNRGKVEVDEEGSETTSSGDKKPLKEATTTQGTVTSESTTVSSKAPKPSEASKAPESTTVSPVMSSESPESTTSSQSPSEATTVSSKAPEATTTSTESIATSSTPTPPPTTTTVPSATTSGFRGPPSIQPPPSFTSSTEAPPTNNGGYGEETNVEEDTTSTSTTTSEAPSLCQNITCHSLATCEPSSGTCICRDGFIGDGLSSCSKKSTADCISLPSLCAENAKCDNSTRSCECSPGYIGDGYVCSPHPQDCVLRKNLCSPEAICQNRRCQCLPGFTGDGVKCVSIHERASNCSQCDENAHCVAGTTCTCNPGYFGNGLCCVPDPLDCVHFTGICHPNAVCNQKSRQCECSSGFSGNGVSCFPQKSCRTDAAVCAKNAICLPTGSCICRHGFKGDPFYKCAPLVSKDPPSHVDLSDVSSCLAPCSSTQLCISGECICKPGFKSNSTTSETCEDVDECVEKTHRCDRVATCQNTIGSHICTCPEGYVGDGTTCVPHVNHGKLSVYCEADGMTLVLGNETSEFEGKIFVKGQAENPHCSKTFSSLLNSHKPYVFKVAFQHCDVQLLENHTMASTVVVQKHAMFLTNKADSYDLRCQYPIGSRAVESHVNVSELATTSTLTDKNSTLAPICRLSVSNDQQLSISSATVGDTLKLALEVTPNDNFGILPRNCFAVNIESGERYTLTDDMGCAIDESLFPQWSVATSSKVQAVFRTFKWPDSSMIRFQCDCVPCVGQCSTPSCISSARFRRHHTNAPIENDEIRQEMILMSGVESLAVSSIINVHDSSEMSSSPLDSEDVVTSSESSICVKLAPLLIAMSSFIVCSAILLYLCSRKPKTLDSELSF